MPRYLVERSFSEESWNPPDASSTPCRLIVENNSLEQVCWLHSYVDSDGRRSLCICDAPSPEAVRRAANRNKLPVSSITEVRTFAPYSYTGTCRPK
jgi:hypothetical protein